MCYHCFSRTNIGPVIADRLLAVTTFYTQLACEKPALLLRPGVLLLLLIFAGVFDPSRNFRYVHTAGYTYVILNIHTYVHTYTYAYIRAYIHT